MEVIRSQQKAVDHIADMYFEALESTKGKVNAESEGVKYSKRTTSDGKQYVEADRTGIFGDDISEWPKQITDYINNEIRKGKDVTVYTANGVPLTITEDTAGKAAFRNYVELDSGKKRRMTDEEYARKLRAEAHIDELSEVSKGFGNRVPDKKHHEFAKDGFDYRAAYFKDDSGYYEVTMSVGKNGRINTVYNVGKIKEADFPTKGLKGPGRSKTETRSATSNNNIPSSTDNVKYSLKDSAEQNAISRKEAQFDIIQDSNAAHDDYHTWIRSADEIKTLEETLADPEWVEYTEYDPDYTRQMAEAAIESGKITVYSSNKIGNGVFVTPSRMEAESYSANSKIYSKTVNINDVAWIDPTQGQYAPIDSSANTTPDIRFSRKDGAPATAKDVQQLQRRNESLKKQLAIAKQEIKLSGGHMIKPTVIDRLASRLSKEYSSSIKTDRTSYFRSAWYV